MNDISFSEQPKPKRREGKEGDLLVPISGDDGLFMLLNTGPEEWTSLDLATGKLVSSDLSPDNLMASENLMFFNGSVTLSTLTP